MNTYIYIYFMKLTPGGFGINNWVVYSLYFNVYGLTYNMQVEDYNVTNSIYLYEDV